jgi:hypothetical protein
MRPEAIASVREFLDELWPSLLSNLKATVERDTTRSKQGPHATT